VVLVVCAAAAAALLFPSAGRGQGEETFVESMSLPNDNQNQISINRLEAGTTYRLRVSGVVDETFQEGGAPRRQLRDAFYCFAAPVSREVPEPCNDSSPVAFDYIRLVINGEVRTLSAVGGAQPYRADHVYSVSFTPTTTEPLIARAATVTFGGTATGNYRLEIYRPACASSAAVLAYASQCGNETRKLGVTSIMQVPKPNKAVDVGGVTIDPAARQILFDAGITDAHAQALIATMIIQARAQRLRDQFYGCLYIGALAPDPHQPIGDNSARNPQKLSAMSSACAKLISDEAEREAAASRPVALASQAGCKVIFYPIYTKKERRSAKRRKQIASAVKRSITGGCASEGPRLGFALKSKRKAVPLYKLTNRKLTARLARVAPKGTPTPANAKMSVLWRKP
jgi:hypothetical protein